VSGLATPTANERLNALCNPEAVGSACDDSEFDEKVRVAKATAVAADDQAEAFLLWCAQTIASIQRGFIQAFRLLKSDSFYEAWCQLERCEVEILALKRQYTITEEDPHRIEYIERMLQRWQSMYPYKIFFSPELLKKRVECSICGARVTPRSDCGHEKFGVYSGEMCHHRVAEVEILGISMVQNPVQRYSVAFLETDAAGKAKDHYNYGNVKFIVERVDSPFHGWDSYLTKRVIAASEVAHLHADDPCPCLSGKSFGDCCSGKTEMIVPHLQIRLYVQPKKALPENELLFREA
jgi:hypothetical protein